MTETSKVTSMSLNVLTSSVTPQRVRDWLGLSTTDPPTDSVIYQMIRTAEIIVNSYNVSSLADDEKNLLILVQTACQMSRNKLFTITKTGITSYNIGRVSLSFDWSNVNNTKNEFCNLFKDLLKRFLSSPTGHDFIGITNRGTGKWIQTQKEGPIYTEVDD